MDIFKGQSLLDFTARFKSDKECMLYLTQVKWEQDYTCIKCSNKTSQIRKDYSRTCNKCSHTESATAGTLFHKVKFGVRKAFFICFEMASSTKSLSATQMGVRYGITEKTARLFMHKIREAMKSSCNYPIEGNVDIDEFVLGGKEKGKVGRSYSSKKKKSICAVELTDLGKIKRMYVMKIEDFSSNSLVKIFNKHIDKKASVRTDEWRGYRPLSKEYTIRQVPSNKGGNFKALHTMIHQIKSWIRTTYSWVSSSNVDRY